MIANFIILILITRKTITISIICHLTTINNKVIVKVDQRYFRPTEVNSLLGDASKAKEKLNWIPRISFEALVKEMVKKDLKLIKKGR